MGDVVSLVEKAQEVVDEEEARRIQEKMRRNEFTLQDYLDQIRAIKKMGAISSVLDMIPGLSGQINPEDIDKSEVFKHEVIISSMTKKERANYLIIGPSRRARIARGSGTSVAEVSRLLKRFERIRTMMRKMAKISKNGNPNPKELAKLARRKRG
jgi:signal recognition particle subunit SRP54